MGKVTHPLYNSWRGMLARCTNPNHNAWHNYGGRGIVVCYAWRYFAGFHRDMGASWRPGLTLDRIDNNGNYEPDNCRWATYKQQALNTKRTNLIDTPWGRIPLGEAAERSGLHRTTIYSRLSVGTDPFREQWSSYTKHGRYSTDERSHGL